MLNTTDKIIKHKVGLLNLRGFTSEYNVHLLVYYE